RYTHEQRATQLVQFFHMLEKHQIVVEALGETKTGIQNNALSSNTSRLTDVHALTQELLNVPSNVSIGRIVLHVAGLAEHVHQTDRHGTVRHRIQRTIALQRTDIVDQPGTEPPAFTHHCGG